MPEGKMERAAATTGKKGNNQPGQSIQVELEREGRLDQNTNACKIASHD